MQLETLLKAGNWREADRETAKRMCQVMERQKEGWLRVEDTEQFPCADLCTIDHLWMKYSNSKFGFSVQKQIWQTCSSPTQYNAEWEKFGDRVGWRKGLLRKEWLAYNEFTFNITAPKGHLPILGFVMQGGDGGRIGGDGGTMGFVVTLLSVTRDVISGLKFISSPGVWGALFSRAQTCKL